MSWTTNQINAILQQVAIKQFNTLVVHSGLTGTGTLAIVSPQLIRANVTVPASASHDAGAPARYWGIGRIWWGPTNVGPWQERELRYLSAFFGPTQIIDAFIGWYLPPGVTLELAIGNPAIVA